MVDTIMESSIIFNPTGFSFFFQGKTHKLEKVKFLIFHYLYENRNRPVTNNEIIDYVWTKDKISSNGYYFIGRSMEVHLVYIKKLANSIDLRIENIHGFGKILITNGFELEFARKQCVVDNSDYEFGSKTITLKTDEQPPKHLVIAVKEFVNIIHKNLIENGKSNADGN